MNLSKRLWPSLGWRSIFGKLAPALWLVGIVSANVCLGQTTVWTEGFESDSMWDSWHVEGGVWAAGSPTSGPNEAFAGNRCAATVLDGNYPPSADARLVRDQTFKVPAATDHPRLRFWQWWRGGTGATRTVEIKVGNGPWQPISAASGWDGIDWVRALFDLSPFSGQSVEIAFHFQSTADAQLAPGWYLDDVTVETGAVGADLINTPEGFEAGLGNWIVDHGIWQVGVPVAGPGQAHSGTNCVGTMLDRNYPPGADSRLISPEFLVPAADQNPRLRFWQWFSIWPGDPAQVEISVGGAEWQPLSGVMAYSSAVWSRTWLDLRPYAGSSVQLAFHFKSNTDENVATGWFIDDVVVETGDPTWNGVGQTESFESGLGDWSVDAGVWETGHPTSGPTQAHTGLQCAGTAVGAPYPANCDTRLISPQFTVPPAGDHPRLRYWQWLNNQPGDPANLEIRAGGGSWQTLSGPLVSSGTNWTSAAASLEAYGGQPVQIAFHFQANGDTNVAAGWFVDDVTVVTGTPKSFIGQPEDFENGIGDWSVDNGVWDVGPPNQWPETAHSGAQCAGTVIFGNYRPNADSRLISPQFTVPDAAQNPRLRFWHWFSIWPGDFGVVELSVAGGPWQALSPRFTNGGVVWTKPLYDLTAFAGKNIRIAFHFLSDSDSNVGPGWFIDDVVVETGPGDLQTINESEGFESGLGNWSVDNGTWETGVVSYGPLQAFKGTNCAATVLHFTGGKYAPNTDSRLISPPFTIPCADASPRLRFAEWYDIADGDEGTVEVRVAGGDWQPVLGPISGSSQAWIAGFYDLSPFAGQRVQIAFHFQSNGDSTVKAGWYIDEVKIQTTLLPALDPVTIAQGKLFTASIASPCQNLRFSLGAGAPPGADIEPSLGILTWFLGAQQAPGVYSIPICVSDAANANAPIQCTTVQVTVIAVNNPPALDPIPPKVIQAGVPLQFSIVAHDPDVPGQVLTYSLDQGAPFGAQIDAATGAFSWTPTPTQATSQFTITVRVTDNGSPPASATASFTASPSGAPTEIRLSVTRINYELITLCIDGGATGDMFSLETTTDLTSDPNAAQWNVLQTIWRGEESYCQTTDSSASRIRYYRVRRVQQ